MQAVKWRRINDRPLHSATLETIFHAPFFLVHVAIQTLNAVRI